MTTASPLSLAGLRVGLFGGGQLARMLALKGHEIGLEMHVLSASAEDPAAHVTRHWHKGSVDDPVAVEKFLESVDIATFESEFLDAELVSATSRKRKIPVWPAPAAMAEIQDRKSQKALLDRFRIPTAEWRAVDGADDARAAFSEFGARVVFKQRRFGYDGYGTRVVRLPKDLGQFVAAELSAKNGWIAERFVPFRRELAISAVRNGAGQIVYLPLVETHQENARCLSVKGPVKHRTLAALKTRIAALLRHLDYRGIIAFELFETGGTLIVNEIAPRVHNSAHYSLDGLTEDQFTLHLKGVLGARLDTPRALAPGFAMLNLLGASDAKPSWRLPPGIRLHWYGKRDNRAGRKMGHINTVGSSPQAALNRLLKARKEFKI